MKNRKLRINSDFVSGHKKDDIVEIHVDSDNVPTNPFWRQRVRDAKLDGCCEFLEEKAKEPKKHKKEVKTNAN